MGEKSQAFVKGGCGCLIAFVALGAVAVMLGGHVYLDAGGAVMLFVIGGLLGLGWLAIFNSGRRGGPARSQRSAVVARAGRTVSAFLSAPLPTPATDPCCCRLPANIVGTRGVSSVPVCFSRRPDAAAIVAAHQPSQSMTTPLERKSTVADIRARFDADVERFSNLQTGQSATIDAPLAMELISRAATVVSSPVQRVLDIGCGAGNNTLRLRQVTERDFDVDLVDLSQPMLDRASQRVAQINGGRIQTLVGDFRMVDLPEGSYDVILAAAVLHHLRDDADWGSRLPQGVPPPEAGGKFLDHRSGDA